MIRSFADKSTAAIFAGFTVRRMPPDLQQRAAEKLTLLNAAYTVDDLRIPPGNRLEKLSGDRAGQWSIRINAAYLRKQSQALDQSLASALADD